MGDVAREFLIQVVGGRGNFHGETRSNDTHESTTDPDALLDRKGSRKEANLRHNGISPIENRNLLIVITAVRHGGTE